MKITKVILLFFVMLLVSVEVFTMPTVNNSNNKGGNEAQRSNQTKVPAWLNANNGFAGMNTGGGTKTVQQSRYYHPPAPTPTAPTAFTPTTVRGTQKVAGAQRVSDGQAPRVVVQTQQAAPAQVIANQAVVRGTAKTAGAKRVSDGQAPDVYVPVPQPTYDTAGIPLGSGEAPGNTMSDYLRSLYANNAAMGNPYSQPGYGNGYGFGSRYGGNWGGGGGDWGGGGGGGGYDSPAWLNYLLSLYSWNIR